MNRGEKSAVGFVAAFIVLATTVAVLYWSGWVTILKNVVVLGSRGNAMVGLTQRTPFVPPEDGRVAQERLEAYLRVCCRVKPFGDKVDAWEEANTPKPPRGKTVFKGRGAGLVGDYLRELEAALETQQMGPAEFGWIADRMHNASERTPSSDSAADSDRILYEHFKERLDACSLGPHARRIAEGFAR